MKAISYALFGSQEQEPNSFTFNTYLRGFMLNAMLQRIIYPDWKIVLNTDLDTFNHYATLLTSMNIELVVHYEREPLCKKMLWRLAPIYHADKNGLTKYTHIICRDLDSPLTLREYQCVNQWIESGLTAHCITDSISHNIPMMGGMIGFNCDKAKALIKPSYQELKYFMDGIDYTVKGSDQDFLCKRIYPIVEGRNEVMHHNLKGMPNKSGLHVLNEVPENLYGHTEDMVESNEICGHIGAAGWYEPKMHVFLAKHRDKIQDLLAISRAYDAFYWTKENY